MWWGIGKGCTVLPLLVEDFVYLFVVASGPQPSWDLVADFENVLGIADTDVQLTLGMAVSVLLVLVVIARPLLFASVDPLVATARGVPVAALGALFLVLLALTVAAAVPVLGILLIFALLVTPAAIAQRLTARPGRAMAIAVLLALAFTWAGLVVGYFLPYPVGFFITSFAFGAYLLVRGGGWLSQRWPGRVVAGGAQ
ncbi:MAG: metal ABC transporter permease [Ktedonobacterales bacterium]|nr:metal ABC transporter permease [Ktedonobacterales bacterium]